MPVRSGRPRLLRQTITLDGAGHDIITARHQDLPVVPNPRRGAGARPQDRHQWDPRGRFEHAVPLVLHRGRGGRQEGGQDRRSTFDRGGQASGESIRTADARAGRHAHAAVRPARSGRRRPAQSDFDSGAGRLGFLLFTCIDCLCASRRAQGVGRGRPRIYGADRIDLAKLAGQRRGWTSGGFDLYGKPAVKRYKTFLATSGPVGGVIRVECPRSRREEGFHRGPGAGK